MSASVRLYRIALISIVAYTSATLLSLMLAHTLLVIWYITIEGREQPSTGRLEVYH